MALRRVIFNLDEQRTSSDSNLHQLYRVGDLMNILEALFATPGVYPAGHTPQNGIICGFAVTPGTGLQVVVNPESTATTDAAGVPGIGFQYDNDNLPNLTNPNPAESPYRPFALWATQALAIAAAAPTNPRIDLVEVQWSNATTNSTAVNIWNDTSKSWNSVANNKLLEATCSLKVKTGTAQASPVAPTVDSGWIAVAQVYVAAGAASLIQSNITDVRPLLSMTVKGAQNVVADDGTIHIVKLTQVAPNTYDWKIN